MRLTRHSQLSSVFPSQEVTPPIAGRRPPPRPWRDRADRPVRRRGPRGPKPRQADLAQRRGAGGRRVTAPAGASGRMPARAVSSSTPAAAVAAGGPPDGEAERSRRCAPPPRVFRAAGGLKLSAAASTPRSREVASFSYPPAARPATAIRRLLDRHGATPVAERDVSRLLHAQTAQPPARVQGRTAERSGELRDLHFVERSGFMFSAPDQTGVEQMDGSRPEARHEASVRGTSRRRSAAAQVRDQDVLPELAAQLLGPMTQPGTARSVERVEQIGASSAAPWACAWVSQRTGPPGWRGGQIRAVADGGPQPGRTALGGGQQLLGLVLGQSPAAGLHEQRGKERGFRVRAARREMGARLAARPGDDAGPRPWARAELGAPWVACAAPGGWLRKDKGGAAVQLGQAFRHSDEWSGPPPGHACGWGSRPNSGGTGGTFGRWQSPDVGRRAPDGSA